MTLTVGSLFSGCGGFDMGFTAAGCRIAWACEIEPKPLAVFRRHHPGVTVHHDVKELRGEAIEPVDALLAGFPCQDVSIAGKREGLAGERTGLFFEVVRLARELRPRPRWLVLENVPGLLSSHAGRDMAAVLRELHGLGYRGGWRVLDLQWFGVPQRRRRVFFVFHLGDWRRAAEILFDGESLLGNPPPRRGPGQDVAGSIAARTGRNGGASNQELDAGQIIAHSLRAEGFDAGEDGTGRGTPLVACFAVRGRGEGPILDAREDGTANAILAPSGGRGGTGCGAVAIASTSSIVRRLTPRECERLMGWPDDYTAWGIDDAGQRIDMADSPRYRMCGNGVGRQHGEWLARRIVAQIMEEAQRHGV